ncbi:MAG: isoprenylcysteine carboxylmethyltransferase family protein [bacterium]
MLFWIMLLTDGLVSGSLVWSLMYPDRRVWPPPSRCSWQFWFTWISVIVLTVGLIILGWQVSNPSRAMGNWNGIVGMVLVVSGLALAVAAIGNLGVDTSAGLKGELITSGIYSYTRNPQYLGDIMIILGWCLIVSHWQVWLTGGLFACWFGLAPFVEETWLKERFGNEYERYCEEVPRFF